MQTFPLGFTNLAGNRVYSCREADSILHTRIEQKVKGRMVKY